MVEDVNSAENSSNEADEASDAAGEAEANIEELKLEDADVEIDFDSSFSEASSDDAAADNATDVNAAAAGDVAEIAALEAQIAQLKTQLEDRNGQYLRLTADFENFRKRTSREKEDLEVQIKCNTISNLLEVVDNFERARAQIKPQNEGEMTVHKSYQSVYKQLVEAMKRIGVAPMRAEGKEFDPNLHEAVMREPTDEYADGTVIEELVRGYILGERVLRHAMVKVAAPLDE
ncbi:nucleotide exchange factor GrpE [Leptolyngbya cf. ectocarpi LEGE 11479]|uniref:Protein GrpE n=1 Tax=Leptolyngbya cf. ectocarpi LEGE 11479 TaxID=1828722 RepID=A0A928ZV48_LEPEC|nr:nucleotide exchange factor GrpE [Leptolyngbya ectocarpi]MBE9068035.1 nucleotide exchange factor GrpE [Leptolyngbya cf. ectocarpi LEGE 11479]